MTIETTITDEARQLLARAHDEIMILRQRVADLEHRAHAYDTIAQLSRLASPEKVVGYAEDVAHRIRELLDRKPAEQTSDGQP